MTDTNENITLQELIIEYPLSVRAVGICMRNGLTTFQKISCYFEVYKTFMKLQGCGVRVESELTELLKSYPFKKEERQQSIITDIKEPPPSYKNLSPLKKSAFKLHIEYLLSTLSLRAKNRLIQQFGNSPIKTLIEKVIDTNLDFLDIGNAGVKTVQELESFSFKLKTFITTLIQMPDSELSKENTKLILKTSFLGLSKNFEQEIQTIFDEGGRIKLFALINKLVSEGVVFKLKEQKIFETIYCSITKSNKSLEQIAVEFQLTKERVRQLKNILEDEIENHFSFIRNLNPNDIRNYGISDSNSIIIIDKEKVNSINLSEGVQFTTAFYGIILGILFNKTHSRLGHYDLIRRKKIARGEGKFRKCYLIEKTAFEIFDFKKLLEDVYLKQNAKIRESFSIYFEGYICEFFKSSSFQYISRIKDICEQLLLNELDLVIDSEGFLNFERNSKKQPYEYVSEILEQSKRLMTVKEISAEIYKKYPELKITETGVRTCLKEKELFIYIGRSSTYGLKKWEQDQENLKGGTIRDMVEEYLKMEEAPKHIKEILTYVLKYRDTNEKNVLTNLKLEKNERFRFYKGGYIGIKGWNYSPESTNFKKTIGTRFTKAFMRKFNNWNLDNVIAFYVSNYGYTQAQVRYLFENKCKEGEIQIINNKIILT